MTDPIAPCARCQQARPVREHEGEALCRGCMLAAKEAFSMKLAALRERREAVSLCQPAA